MSSSNGTPLVSEPAPSRFEHLFDSIKHNKIVDKAGKAIDKVSAAVKAHPLAAIGIAVGAGYVVMRIIRRR